LFNPAPNLYADDDRYGYVHIDKDKHCNQHVYRHTDFFAHPHQHGYPDQYAYPDQHAHRDRNSDRHPNPLSNRNQNTHGDEFRDHQSNWNAYSLGESQLIARPNHYGHAIGSYSHLFANRHQLNVHANGGLGRIAFSLQTLHIAAIIPIITIMFPESTTKVGWINQSSPFYIVADVSMTS
jgi:hypothetical protein